MDIGLQAVYIEKTVVCPLLLNWVINTALSLMQASCIHSLMRYGAKLNMPNLMKAMFTADYATQRVKVTRKWFG